MGTFVQSVLGSIKNKQLGGIHKKVGPDFLGETFCVFFHEKE